MDTVSVTLSHLFDQLGLPSSESDINAFISDHRPIPAGQSLHEASCWSPAQAAFLREAVADDAQWAEVVDELSTRLR